MKTSSRIPGNWLRRCGAALTLTALVAAGPARAQEPGWDEWRVLDRTGFFSDLAFADMDGDGDLDLVVAGTGIEVRHNDGDGEFAAGTVIPAPPTELVLGDIDGDGWTDVVTTGLVYRNDGFGELLAGQEYGADVDSFVGLSLADVDRDGLLDVIASASIFPDDLVVYFRNLGGGLFATATTIAPALFIHAAGDVDGDGDVDVIADDLYLNDGSGGFTQGPAFDGHARLMVDLDDDGDLDVVGEDSQFYGAAHLNDGSGGFTAQPIGSMTGSDVYAVADLDGDGDPDVATNREVFRNDGAGGFAPEIWFGDGTSTLVAFADVDGDLDVDIAVGNVGRGTSVLLLNDGGGSLDAPAQSIDFGPVTLYGSAIGDADGDGSLDVAVGVGGASSRVLLNDGGGNFDLARGHDLGLGVEEVLAFADLDGDLDLDVIGGGASGMAVYLNQLPGGFVPGYSSSGAWATDVSLGDLDGDGDLDAVFTYGPPATIAYFNDGSGGFDQQVSLGGLSADGGVVLGDVDGDLDLDLVHGGTATLLLNDGAGGFGAPVQIHPPSDPSRVALSDLDGDGDLDLSLVHDQEPNYVYRNLGGVFADSGERFGEFTPGAWHQVPADLDGDGDVDVLVDTTGNDQIHVNDGAGNLDLPGAMRLVGGWQTGREPAVGDLDGDGALDVVMLSGARLAIYRNGSPARYGLVNSPAYVAVSRPGLTADGGAMAEIVGGPEIAVPYRLFDAEADPVREIRAYYSRNGGGEWLPATPTAATTTRELAASPAGTPHTFHWDSFADGLMGLYDNVAFRIEALSSPKTGVGGMAREPHRPYASATTAPFRMRGTGIRVRADGQPTVGALVYRLPVGQTLGAALLTDLVGEPLVTGATGYLRGAFGIAAGDRLVAVLPVESGPGYTLYHTSATPTETGLSTFEVSGGGDQELEVSSANPLVLFDLTVSLQWDARGDASFLDQLRFDLARTSALLFDWSDGQVALGGVTIHHDRSLWTEADVLIHATNRMRPSASQGGVVADLTEDPDVPSHAYAPGQVHIGAEWNRYGDAGGSLDEDWPRTLAHELGHYLLYLDDNYLGLDPMGRLVPVDTCTTAMGDPYREDHPNDEFHTAASWLPSCGETLSNQITGRSDWETITTFYPWLDATRGNPGPSVLPLTAPQIEIVDDGSPIATLPDPSFNLTSAGSPVQSGSGTRAYLIGDDWLTDLGRPTLDRVHARGARPGERLCVFDLGAGRSGCEVVTETDSFLDLVSDPSWRPEVLIRPRSARELDVEVRGAPTGQSVHARLYRFNGPSLASLTMSEAAGTYSASFTVAAAEDPAIAGYVHVWIDEPEPRREIVADYALGGNPGRLLTLSGSPFKGRQAPAMSADGQVLLYTDVSFVEGDLFAFQAATVATAAPSWMTAVGQAYHLVKSAGAPDLAGAAIAFHYLGREVPIGEEPYLKIAYRAPGAGTWQLLPTTIDAGHNVASATAAGAGLYALWSSIEIPLGAGWNVVPYTASTARPVAEALASIAGDYSVVFGHDATDPADPWKIHDPLAPDWVNDLAELEFPRSYWIHMRRAATLHLSSADPSRLGRLRAEREATSSLVPPAVLFGEVIAGGSFTPAAGMTVAALVGGSVCATATLTDLAGRLVFVAEVAADASEAGCGRIGDGVELAVDGNAMIPEARWDNTSAQGLTLRIDEPVGLRRNDDVRAITPVVSPDLATVFATLRASAPYLTVSAPGTPDPDAGVVADSGRPLVLYEYEDGLVLRLHRDGDDVVISW